MSDDPVQQRLEKVRAYHRRTKHRLDRYAAGPGCLDWESQPEPFRRFDGAPLVPLPLIEEDGGPSYRELFGREVQPRPIDVASLGALLRLSLGLAAWKQYGGSRWALRCNPSSGNLHPTEGYVLTAGLGGLDDGVFHYAPHEHALERRCRFSPDDTPTPQPQLLLGLSSIAWREAWKYGERAFRYVQLDIGHAIAAVRFAAATLGWQAEVLRCSDPDLSTLLGLDRTADFTDGEREAPDVLLRIPGDGREDSDISRSIWVARARQGEWYGRANSLGPPHRHHWPVIDEVAAATRAERPEIPAARVQEVFSPPLPSACRSPAARIITGRRSAQHYDGVTEIGAEDLFRMLDALLPRADTVPWDARPEQARIHPVLLLHRVTGLPPGLYALPRRAGIQRELRQALKGKFDWSRPENCPDGLPLFHLLSADARSAAKTLSCHQDIAADGAFTLGMLAEFDAGLEGVPWRYRRLYWEAGMLGQVLYLEAEAAGTRGTGIGCFFDDSFHEILGLRDTRFQSLYHFTVGEPLEDSRLQTLPAYEHLRGAQAGEEPGS